MLVVPVDISSAGRLVCKVARTASEQARGLQGHAPLDDGTGMLFTFFPARAASFWMGTVSFPLDLVFADASGRIARIVHAAQPGTQARWTHPVVGAVVEVPGGWCARHGVSVGGVVRVAGRKLGQQTYNLLRTITEADLDPEAAFGADGAFEKFAPEADLDFTGDVGDSSSRLGPGYYTKEPQHDAPDFGGVPNGLSPDDRFRGHGLPDTAYPEAMGGVGGDMPSDGWQDVGGYDQGYQPYADPLSNDMEAKDTLDGDAAPAAVRMSAGRDVVAGGGLAVDFTELVPELIRGAVEEGLPWRPTYVNPRRVMALVGPIEVGRWLHRLNLREDQVDVVFDVARSPEGLDKLAQGFLLADDGQGQPLVDSANVQGHGDAPVLVLTRRQT